MNRIQPANTGSPAHSGTTADSKVDSDAALFWLKAAAYTSLLAAVTGLVLLTLPDSRAQDRPRGFEGGGNPFADRPAGEGAAPGVAPPPNRPVPTSRRPTPAARRQMPRNTSPSAGRGGGIPDGGHSSDDVPDPKLNPDGVEVGGEPPGGVISNGRQLPLEVNAETGAGSREVITDFNYPDADIMDIAKTLGKLTGKNFIVDKDVKGRVSIISNAPITVGDAWKAFLTALDMNNFTLIPSGKYIRIARQRDARDKQLNTYVGDWSPDSDALITRVFPLKYISADEVARTFRSFMPANSRIIPHSQTNTVIVTDTGANIQKLAKMLEFLDVEGFDAGIDVIPVKHASAAELSKLIDTLLPGTPAGGVGGRPKSRARPGASRFAARRTKEGGVINTIIADERTNTLIVHANNAGAREVKELVGKLDKKMPVQVGGGKIHVVYLQFAEAEKIAQTLNNLGSQAQAPARRGRTASGGLGVNPTSTTLFEGAIKVSPDKATNSLVITASPSDFATVQRVINRLDIPRDEVYIEAAIMEMAIERNFEFSANLVMPKEMLSLTPNADLLGFVTSPFGQRGATIPIPAGGETTVRVNNQDVKVRNFLGLLRAVQTNTNANVLATPQILTLDNTEASFESGERIPVPTVSQTQTAVTTGITKERVALSVKVTPQINKVSNFVKLDIETQMEDISNRLPPAQVQGLAFATTDRRVKTSVVVADGDTVVLGGLIRDKRNDSVSKVPILGDIPLLGWLFRSKASTVEKTNLIILMSPHIIRQYEKVRAILDQKLEERDRFIEKNAGGDDPMRGYRDDIIRKLPEMSELLENDVDTTDTIQADPGSEAPAAGDSEIR